MVFFTIKQKIMSFISFICKFNDFGEYTGKRTLGIKRGM